MASATTSRAQRIGIWIIAVVMLAGTVISFLVVILSNQNTTTADNQATQTAQQTADAHAKTSDALTGYSAAAFDPTKVGDTTTSTVLVQGTGKTAAADSTVNVSYFGWTSDGKIFDSTNQSGKNTPISLSLSEVIQGWTTGLTGVKAGSTVELTIPAAQAYGTDASTGQPSGPLQFIIQLESVS